MSEADWSARDSFYSKAQEYGFKDADTLEKYAPLHKTFSERNIDPGQYASLIGGKPPQQQQNGQAGEQPMTRAELEKMLADRDEDSKADAEWSQHQAAYPALVQSKLKELKAEGPVGKLLAKAIEHDIMQARVTAKYPDGHRLAGKRLHHVTPEMIEGVFSQNKYDAVINELRGHFLSSSSKENAGVSSTAAGAGGQGGATSDKEADADRRARGIDTRTREEKMAIARRVRENAGAGKAGASMG